MERVLEKEVTVNASADDVWKAWTTRGGVLRFFAPDARLDIRPGGAYEVLFDLDVPPGKQGSEGSKVLSFVPGRMLSFTWGAPPKYGKARKQLAQWVVVFFEPVGGKKTRVRLFELGWKKGKEGEAVYRYFDRAWNLVLRRLAYSFEKGAIDWKNPWRPSA
jgi:uncharacterized protein YndB with AHSA1/START domain